MKRQILTDNETKRFLAKAFGVELMTVWRPLTFKRYTALCCVYESMREMMELFTPKNQSDGRDSEKDSRC